MSGAVGRDLDVVVVCEINVDIVVTGLNGPPDFGAERLVDAVTLTAGSSGVLAATGMADLGLRVGVCGLAGDDPFGHYMLEHLDRHGIDRGGVVVDPAERTGAGVLLSTRLAGILMYSMEALSLRVENSRWISASGTSTEAFTRVAYFSSSRSRISRASGAK